MARNLTTATDVEFSLARDRYCRRFTAGVINTVCVHNVRQNLSFAEEHTVLQREANTLVSQDKDRLNPM